MDDHTPHCTIPRRSLLRLSVAAAAAVPLAAPFIRPSHAHVVIGERRLRLHNRLTGESFDDVFWADGAPVPEVLARIDWLLRDPHNDRTRRMDLALLQRLHGMQARLETDEPFQVLSAFRSLETNRRLIAQGHSASQSSLHLEGKAVDLRLPGVRNQHLYRAALATGSGGTGVYAGRGFVHVDTGKPRQWQGT